VAKKGSIRNSDCIFRDGEISVFIANKRGHNKAFKVHKIVFPYHLANFPTILKAMNRTNTIDLLKHIKLFKQGNIPGTCKLVTELYARNAIPVACIIFCCIGFIIGNSSANLKRFQVLFFGLLKVLSYYYLHNVFVESGYNSFIDPFQSAQAANALFLVVLIILVIIRLFRLSSNKDKKHLKQ
jgi:lipopolysaccharide export LptBFGC system permease protein LptF